VLQDLHAAEDAFQATFLTLARKAGSIDKRTSLSSWLYKVAYRISLRARARASRQAACEHPLHTLPAVEPGHEPPDQAAWRELRQVLDSEVHRLPEKYRVPFVLCYLEGKTNEQAAAELGCPKGTVLSRLARARDWLRGRLIRRGVALTVLPVAALLAERAEALAKMTPVLVNGTVHFGLLTLAGKLLTEKASTPAIQLMQEMSREMNASRWKPLLAGAAAILLLFGGGGYLAYRAWAANKLPAALTAPLPDPAKECGCHSSERDTP
jgi:polysaccharide export outer membrane protein